MTLHISSKNKTQLLTVSRLTIWILFIIILEVFGVFLVIVLEISIYRRYSGNIYSENMYFGLPIYRSEVVSQKSSWFYVFVCLFILDPNSNFVQVFYITFQKVYYSMYSTMDNMVYESTVRGCAWDCLPKDDFQNCSSELHGSRGCVTRNCCRDNDLCNQGSRTNSVLTSSHLSCLFLLVLSSYFVTW